MSVRRIESADEGAAAEACAQHVLAILGEAVRANGRATLAVSGGSSPKRLFARMAAAKFNWRGVHIFWVDERCVPPTDGASNYKLVKEYLIEPAGIPETQVHRVVGEIAPEEAARRYADEIRAFFSLAESALPRFDALHRGVGPDAHTASLFPGDPLIDDRAGIAAATFAAKFNQWRVTLLPGVLLAAVHTVVYAPGPDKAEALGHVFGDEYDPKKYPSQIGLRDGGEMTWFLT
ncbi:MAG: 6-phosphogluconolactonase [Bryobacteraceae bacterium]|jgi:6-phosphogluconolactonase